MPPDFIGILKQFKMTNSIIIDLKEILSLKIAKIVEFTLQM